nr:MAG TPA: Ubinuclein domain protein [Caudoviricetes sp.]
MAGQCWMIRPCRLPLWPRGWTSRRDRGSRTW